MSSTRTLQEMQRGSLADMLGFVGGLPDTVVLLLPRGVLNCPRCRIHYYTPSVGSGRGPPVVITLTSSWWEPVTNREGLKGLVTAMVPGKSPGTAKIGLQTSKFSMCGLHLNGPKKKLFTE